MPDIKFPRPPLSLIEHLPGRGVDLYIGDSRALSSPAILARHGITTVVNCAVNLDVNLVTVPAASEQADDLVHGHAGFRYYKIGMIDGSGNTAEHMLGAYFILKAALDQVMPDRPSYPNKTRGNILVNCRGGRSRSVTLVALFLHLDMPQKYPTLAAAIDHIRQQRLLQPAEWHETPKPSLIASAEFAIEQLSAMRLPA